MLRISPKFTYPLWLLAHIFQSEMLRNSFIKLSLKLARRGHDSYKKTGLIDVEVVDVKEVNETNFQNFIYQKKPLLIKGLAKVHKENPKINHEYLIEYFGDFKTIPRVGDNNQSSEQSIKDILTSTNSEVKQTIASAELTHEERLKNDIDIESWIPHPSILKSPLLNNTLFVSSDGFYTRLHMEAGRLLNVQLSGKKTWYLIDPKYSHIVEPLLSNTTIHFSDVVKDIEDIKNKLAPQIPVYECTLEQGDVLLIPPFFWHTVFCKEKAVSTTYQWLTLVKPVIENPFLSLFLLTSRKPSVFDILFGRGRK